MATSAERFSLFPASFVYGEEQTLNLSQMQSFSVNPGAQRTRIWASGAVDPKAHILANASPSINFGTRDLATYFGAVSPVSGLALTGAGTFRLQERADLDGVFLAGETDGDTHETFTTTGGIILPVSLSASQDDADGAVVESQLIALYNGTTSPIVHTTGVDFDAATAPAFVSQFYLGPVYHNAVEMKGIISASVQFGVGFSPRRTSGDVYPRKGAITQRAPMFQFTTLKCDVTATIDVFLRATAGTVAMYLWKGVNAGSRVAVATAQHCKISAAAGAWGDDSISAQDNDDGTVTVSVMPTGQIAVSVASAIP